MSEREIKSELCYYAPENPNNNLGAYEDEDYPQPRNECSCDNCFYGRDKLAMQLLQAREHLDRLAEALRMITTFDYTDLQCDNGHGARSVATEALQSLTPNEP